MRSERPGQRLRFAAVLLTLPLFASGINYCLINELTGLPPCVVGTEGPECTEHSDGPASDHHLDGDARRAPTSPQPSGATHPCCSSLVDIDVPKVIELASAQPAPAAAVLVETSATVLLPAFWHGRQSVPTERILPSLHRSPSASRAPPLT